nr:uncharacterized protein LOC106688737 [Halyomorpha halys]
MAESAKYTPFNRDERSPYLRRTPDDYGDIRDTFEHVEAYGPGANPGFTYTGWIPGQSLFRVGATPFARNHHLMTLHHWIHNPKVKNFDYLYRFKPDLPRPLPEHTEYLAGHHRRRLFYLPNSIPFHTSYAGFIPMMDDLEIKTQFARVECLAKFLRGVDKKREELMHTFFRVSGAGGKYIFPIPELSEREFTWSYKVPLACKGEHKFTKPLPADFLYPDQSKHRGRIDIPGYGGHMPGLVGKFGKSLTYHQKQGLAEFKLNYFSHLSDVWNPSLCRSNAKSKNNLNEGYLVQKQYKSEGKGIDWINNCPYKPAEFVLSDREKEIIRQQNLRPSKQNRKGCSRYPTRREVYDKVLFEKCPSQLERKPKYKSHGEYLINQIYK